MNVKDGLKRPRQDNLINAVSGGEMNKKKFKKTVLQKNVNKTQRLMMMENNERNSRRRIMMKTLDLTLY